MTYLAAASPGAGPHRASVRPDDRRLLNNCATSKRATDVPEVATARAHCTLEHPRSSRCLRAPPPGHVPNLNRSGADYNRTTSPPPLTPRPRPGHAGTPPDGTRSIDRTFPNDRKNLRDRRHHGEKIPATVALVYTADRVGYVSSSATIRSWPQSKEVIEYVELSPAGPSEVGEYEATTRTPARVCKKADNSPAASNGSCLRVRPIPVDRRPKRGRPTAQRMMS